MDTQTLLLILLATGLLIVLVLFAAILWVVLTILFKFRRGMSKTKATAAKGLSLLKLVKPGLPLALIAALAAWLWPDNND